MRKTIEFTSNAGSVPSPVERSREASFQDITLKEDFRKSVCRFRQGITWLRFLPPVKGSSYDWILPIDAYQDIAGITLTSSNTFDRNNVNFFELVSTWIRRHRPELAANKDTNPNGLRLWNKRVGLAWVIEEQAPEGERLRLFKGSLYDGGRGGSTGLAYNIHLEATSRDQEPNSETLGQLVYGDITAPAAGRLVKIDKLATAQGEYANYKIGIGKHAAPIEALMTLLTEEEHNMICPLEQTIHIPTEAEQKDALRRYIGPSIFSEIFGGEKTISTPAKREVVSNDSNDEPDPTPAPAPEPVAAKPAPTPVVDDEPAPAVAAKPQPVAAAVEPVAEAEEVKPYTIREVTKLLGEDEAGLKTLIANKHRIPKTLLDVVKENAQEMGIAFE